MVCLCKIHGAAKDVELAFVFAEAFLQTVLRIQRLWIFSAQIVHGMDADGLQIGGDIWPDAGAFCSFCIQFSATISR